MLLKEFRQFLNNMEITNAHMNILQNRHNYLISNFGFRYEMGTPGVERPQTKYAEYLQTVRRKQIYDNEKIKLHYKIFEILYRYYTIKRKQISPWDLVRSLSNGQMQSINEKTTLIETFQSILNGDIPQKAILSQVNDGYCFSCNSMHQEISTILSSSIFINGIHWNYLEDSRSLQRRAVHEIENMSNEVTGLIPRFHRIGYRKSSLQDTGLCNTDHTHFNTTNRVKCIYNSITKLYTCPVCGSSYISMKQENTQYTIEDTLCNLSEAMQNYHVPTSNDRVKQMIGYLNRMMGIDGIIIPQEVYEHIRNKMNHDGISPKSVHFNAYLIRKYLSGRNKLGKWKKHIATIYTFFTGKPLISLNIGDRDRILELYEVIQSYVKLYMYNNRTRVNFPPCWYFIRKISEALNINVGIDFFHTIKHDENIKELDKMWKYICDNVRQRGIQIEYIPTM